MKSPLLYLVAGLFIGSLLSAIILIAYYEQVRIPEKQNWGRSLGFVDGWLNLYQELQKHFAKASQEDMRSAIAHASIKDATVYVVNKGGENTIRLSP